MTAPGPPPYGRNQAGEVIDRIPFLPTLAGVLIVIGLLFALLGSCDPPVTFRSYSTSTSQLCSAYRDVLDAFDNTYQYDISSELDALVRAGKDYDDSGVRSDAAEVDSYSATLISESTFRRDTRNIAAKC